MRALLTCTITLLLLTAPGTLAGFTQIGDPMEGGSWAQRFQEDGVGSYDFMAVTKINYFVDPPELLGGAGFQVPAFRSFTSSGWTVQGTTTTAIAARAGKLTWQQFDIGFLGPSSAALEFHFYAFDGTVLKESVKASWSGSSWKFTLLPSAEAPSRETIIQQVPAPGAALLGVIGLWCAGWIKRRLS